MISLWNEIPLSRMCLAVFMTLVCVLEPPTVATMVSHLSSANRSNSASDRRSCSPTRTSASSSLTYSSADQSEPNGVLSAGSTSNETPSKSACATFLCAHKAANEHAAILARLAADLRLLDFSSSAFSSHPGCALSQTGKFFLYGAAFPATVLPVSGSQTVTCSSSVFTPLNISSAYGGKPAELPPLPIFTVDPPLPRSHWNTVSTSSSPIQRLRTQPLLI
mmetsp:Transcript_15692/g.64133  ORF Transcript_15692/g.64133 Transcript_15692/m.64133 type:complete len:221 (+) Transcript_15692:935-1597(+)